MFRRFVLRPLTAELLWLLLMVRVEPLSGVSVWRFLGSDVYIEL